MDEAKNHLDEGGIPIGAVLVEDNHVISKGHNKLIQNDSVILHGEMDAIENAGRLFSDDYKNNIIYYSFSMSNVFWYYCIIFHVWLLVKAGKLLWVQNNC